MERTARTEWTSALAVAEGLTDWVVDRHPAQWPEGEEDPRQAVMVLLAHAIQTAGRDQGIQATDPSQLGPIPLRPVGANLTVERAHALLRGEKGLGPVGGQVGADAADELLRMSEQPDNGNWAQVVHRAADVVAQHEAEHRVREATIADRRTALARDAGRRRLEFLAGFFGEDY